LGGDSLPRNAAAKLMIGARQRRLGLSSCSSLPAPWPVKIWHLALHPHNTLACNHTSLPPSPRQTMKTCYLLTTHPPFILGIAVLFWAAAHHVLNSYSPLGKLSQMALVVHLSSPHPTSPALLTSPTPYQREFVCGACIGTAQIGASLVAPLGFIFKRSSLRSLRDMIIL